MTDLKRILHVEDDPSIQAVAKVALEAVGGFQVLSCSSGQEALDQVQGFAPDFILLDVMMPGMDGFEVARRMRQIDRLEMTKIVFLTAKGTQRDKETGYASGGEYYLIKPFDNEVFVHTINEIMAYG